MEDSGTIALLENLQREDLNFYEEAVAYYNLIQDHSYTQDQLAQNRQNNLQLLISLEYLNWTKELIDEIIKIN